MHIYEIRNITNNKRYIGQTSKSKPRQRWNEHKCDLRKNRHRNKHLQHAWNKYGEVAFEFNILRSYNSLDELNEAERKIIKEKGDYNIEPGGDVYPVSDETRLKISKAKRKDPYPTVVSSDGKKHKIEPTLAAFCRKHNLWESSFHMMLVGRINYAQGWHLPHIRASMSEARSKAHPRNWKGNIVIDPNGNEHKITNLRKFCRDHGLGDHFKGMVRGKRTQYKGWHLKGTTIIPAAELKSRKMRGSKHPLAKLTEEQVTEIRAAHQSHRMSLNQLHEHFNLPKGTLWNIISRQTWKHI